MNVTESFKAGQRVFNRRTDLNGTVLETGDTVRIHWDMRADGVGDYVSVYEDGEWELGRIDIMPQPIIMNPIIVKHIASIDQQIEEYLMWIETFDRDRTDVSSVIGWCEKIIELRANRQALALLNRDMQNVEDAVAELAHPTEF